jgi:hypothetical protein
VSYSVLQLFDQVVPTPTSQPFTSKLDTTAIGIGVGMLVGVHIAWTLREVHSKARAAGSQPDRPHATVEEHPLGLIRGACLLSSHKSTSLGRYSSDRVQLIRPQQSLAAQLQLTHNWCHIVYRFNCPPLMAFSLRCPHWYSFPAPLSWTRRARPRQGSPKPSPL